MLYHKNPKHGHCGRVSGAILWNSGKESAPARADRTPDGPTTPQTDPDGRDLIVSAFTTPLVETWEGEPPIALCDAFRVFLIVWFAEERQRPRWDTVKIADCCALVKAAAGYGVPFSSDPLEAMQNGGETCHISLAGGRTFVNRAQIKVVGARGGTQNGHGVVLCTPPPVLLQAHFAGGQIAAPLSMAGAAFLFGAMGWALSAELWRTCMVLEGNGFGS